MLQYDSPPSIDLIRLRHSASHVMPGGAGDLSSGQARHRPPIEHGFYYDFDLPRALTRTTCRNREAHGRDPPPGARVHLPEISPEEARTLFADQPFKLELIEGILSGGLDENGVRRPNAPALVYESGPFVDLCRGPHVGSARQIPPED